MSYRKHVVLWDFILALWWRPAPKQRPTCKFPTFKRLILPYSLRSYSLPAPQRCQSAQTLHYITLHYITLHYITLHYITLYYITLHYHGILQLALYIYISYYNKRNAHFDVQELLLQFGRNVAKRGRNMERRRERNIAEPNLS